MSELKKCPFCGSEAITTTFIDPDDFDYMPIEVNDCDAEVTCENERCINGWWLTQKEWNTRPIEDALNARIAELESLVEQLIWVGNDLLVSNTNPVTITLFNGLVCNAKERER